MGDFDEKLRSDRFLITAELNPPKGVDVKQVLEMGEQLRGVVDACNVSDSHNSIMTTAPISLAHLLLDRGIEPILQVTGRDRNRIALQADLLSAYVLGIKNILCMTGDPPGAGDHPEAKAVFDLDGIGLVKTASSLMGGHDLARNHLKGVPQFCIGATVNPCATDLAREIHRMEQKVEAGAVFFQSQAIFDAETIHKFAARTQHIKAPVLAGIILLKSARMARALNENLPGVHIPEELINEMERAEDRPKQGVEIAARIIRQVKGAVRGVHIMAIGLERCIPQVVEEAGLLGNR